MLHIVATPIGNLKDLSLRAIDTLKNADAILCEDTRRSSHLLDHYEIQKPLISYHKFKEKSSLDKTLENLKNGKNLALISDAGTPCINDPGRILVEACIEAGIEVDAIPGPCSVIQALVLSGFPTERFQFIGFLPKNPEKTIRQILAYPGTTVAFESPERVLKTLALVQEDQTLAVVREMTKTFQERLIATAGELLERFREKKPRGEFVLVFPPGEAHDDTPIEEIVKMLRDLHGLSLKEAIKLTAKFKDIPKRDVYKKFHL